MLAPLERWARPHPIVRPDRLRPVAMTMAAAAPFCSPDALLTAARITLWIFALDDAFDEELEPESSLIEQAHWCRGAARGSHPSGGRGALLQLLCDVRDELA